tara:strand:+ start:1692 stop:1877 length:186 start_codon:yes stop_codon:yes gene_type:complete
MAEDYLKNADTILEGMEVDEDKEKWVKICRALKEAGKTDCFYYQQGERIVGKESLEKLLNG